MARLETGSVIEAIKAINPDAQVVVTDNDPEKIRWDRGDVIAKDVILAKVIAMQYVKKRKAEYPSWQQQMDILYHSGVEGLKTELKKIKDKHPK
tara:strand:+ start:606 stop:887 length:282 start_codon:yes stop_codon:yes gene_type:complete